MRLVLALLLPLQVLAYNQNRLDQRVSHVLAERLGMGPPERAVRSLAAKPIPLPADPPIRR